MEARGVGDCDLEPLAACRVVERYSSGEEEQGRIAHWGRGLEAVKSSQVKSSQVKSRHAIGLDPGRCRRPLERYGGAVMSRGWPGCAVREAVE